MSQDLQQRIDMLERQAKSWKRIALSLLAGLLLMTALGTVGVISSLTRAAAERNLAEQARAEAEYARQEAMKAEKKALEGQVD